MIKLSDNQAAQIIERMDSPLREAVASIVWWDCVARQEMKDDFALTLKPSMPKTYLLMDPLAYPREYPSEQLLIAGLIAIGYSEKEARKRVVDEEKARAYNERHKKRMVEMRKAKKERNK